MTKQLKKEQALTKHEEAVVTQQQMVPADQVKDLVRVAVQAALEATQRAAPIAQRTPPGRDAESDVRMVLRTADFLLRASGLSLKGNILYRGDGAFFNDPSMVESYRMIRQMMQAYGVIEEPIEFVKRQESPGSWVDERTGGAHRTATVDTYADDAILDNLEGGWGRRG